MDLLFAVESNVGGQQESVPDGPFTAWWRCYTYTEIGDTKIEAAFPFRTWRLDHRMRALMICCSALEAHQDHLVPHMPLNRLLKRLTSEVSFLSVVLLWQLLFQIDACVPFMQM